VTADTRRIFLIPNTHFDNLWHDTFAVYSSLHNQTFLAVLDQADADPEFRFAVNSIDFLKPFLRAYPEAAERFRRHLAAGRIELGRSALLRTRRASFNASGSRYPREFRRRCRR